MTTTIPPTCHQNAFANIYKARAAGKHIVGYGEAPLQPYRCQHCHRWHLRQQPKGEEHAKGVS